MDLFGRKRIKELHKRWEEAMRENAILKLRIKDMTEATEEAVREARMLKAEKAHHWE